MNSKIVLFSLILIMTGLSAKSQKYKDGRPFTLLRMDAKDQGIVLHYGDGPGRCPTLDLHPLN